MDSPQFGRSDIASPERPQTPCGDQSIVSGEVSGKVSGLGGLFAKFRRHSGCINSLPSDNIAIRIKAIS